MIYFAAKKQHNMGSFGIYVIVVTFIFVIYYVVMICLDLFGTKGERKDSVEVIHAGAPVDKATPGTVPSATVKEEGDGKYSIDGGNRPESMAEGPSDSKAHAEPIGVTAGKEAEPTPERGQAHPATTAADIENADVDELAAQSQAKVDGIKQEFVNTAPTIQGAVYVDDLEELCREARLKAEQEKEQAEQLGL